jgi:hypothetical protein
MEELLKKMSNPRTIVKPKKWFLTYYSHGSTIPKTKRKKNWMSNPQGLTKPKQ